MHVCLSTVLAMASAIKAIVGFLKPGNQSQEQTSVSQEEPGGVTVVEWEEPGREVIVVDYDQDTSWKLVEWRERRVETDAEPLSDSLTMMETQSRGCSPDLATGEDTGVNMDDTVGDGSASSLLSENDTNAPDLDIPGSFCSLLLPCAEEVTPDGGEIAFHKNYVNIRVPEGAVEETVPLEIALDVSVGPSHYPEGVAQISPVLKIHPTMDVALKKPLTLTMPHLLAKSDGLTVGVLKATCDSTGQYTFERLDADAKLTGNNSDKITFTLTHFCYLQLYAEVRPGDTLELSYCFCPVVPDFSKVSADSSVLLYYCLTYFDPIFLEALESQCKIIPRLAESGYHIDFDMMVQFAAPHSLTVDTLHPMVPPPSPSETGWKWRSEMQMAKNLPLHPAKYDKRSFQYWADRFIYPPTYILVASVSGGSTRCCSLSVTFHSKQAEAVNSQLLPSAQTVNIQLPSVSAAATPSSCDAGQFSPEYNAFQRCHSTLTLSLNSVINRVTDILFAKGLIPSAVEAYVHQRIYSDEEKVQKVLAALRDTIQLDAGNYHKVIKALEDDADPWIIENVCTKLRTLYEVEKGAFICGVFDAHKSELIQEISPRLDNVCYRLYNLSVLESKSRVHSADHLFSLLKEKLKGEPQVLPCVCAALNKAIVSRQLVETIKDEVRQRYPAALSLEAPRAH